ncbi:hypothetical protein FALCPG4_004002 [Fusarium falciforme]
MGGSQKQDSGEKLEEIPGPPALPILGNILDVDLNNGLESVINHGRTYGPIFGLTFGGQREIYITNQKLTEELCDESRFCKLVCGGIEKLRPAAGDGLFTAHDGSPAWGVAHRILMPLFGPLKIREMFEDMVEISEQLCLKWARLGASTPLDVSKEFTRLTVDTIALCSMGYRFNSFYLDDKMHPFVESMFEVLAEADIQAALPDMAIRLRRSSLAKFKKNIGKLTGICKDIIHQRKENPVDGRDLLNAMLHGRDPKTGEGLSEESIIHNMITFLIAGHETTSGLLSFAFYYLLENPDALRTAREEVDNVVGQDSLSPDHLHKLPYLDAVLRESLRLMPTAPGFFIKPRKDEVIGGKYAVKTTDPLFVLLHLVHRDPAIWGSDAEDFKPERMLQQNFDQLPPGAWKPFGNGILGFKMRASLRDGKRVSSLLRDAKPSDIPQSRTPPVAATSKKPASGPPILILYGSNSGTCEALAHYVASDASRKGFLPDAVNAINTVKGNLPKDRPVLFIAASYDGQPSDNAAAFVSWLQELKSGGVDGVKYAVFGCGHRDWKATLFKAPKIIDAEMERAGAERLAPMGKADAAVSDMFSDLEDWLSSSVWPELERRYALQPDTGATQFDVDLSVSIDKPPRLTMRRGFVQATVTDSRVLSSPGAPEKRHLELQFPPGMTYEPGDHLQVLPANSLATVQRVLSRFSLSGDTILTIKSPRALGLPTNVPITALDLFSGYVELGQTASCKNILALASAASHGGTKATLESLASTSYETEICKDHVSVLDLLERFPDLPLGISAFLMMLPQMRPRTYSLSSSARWKPGHGSLTYSVVKSAQFDGIGTLPTPRGVASNYLASLTPGHVVYVSLRSSKPEFRLPAAPAAPIIMISVGAGLAPFRGFVQERMLGLKDGRTRSPALLLYGCRGPGLDDMYRSEMNEYERSGAVKILRAYSRDPDAEQKYVQDLIWAYKDVVGELWGKGAVVFICSGKKISDLVFESIGPILFNVDKKMGNTTARSVAEWRQQLSRKRYVAEVFN